MSADGSAPETEYEKYLKTTDLLGLQKPVADQCCHDEMAFQITHQVAELWMKLCRHELRLAVKRIDAGQLAEARHTLHRMYLLIELLSQNFRVLETMSPRAYFTVRAVLGKGSGQESPGFNALLDEPSALRDAFKRFLQRREIDLLAMHRDPASQPEVFAVAEALIDFDAAFQHFRYQHLALVRRIIGGRTPSLKGAPAELLEHGIKQSFFPELWGVREALFRDFMPGRSLYDDDDTGPGAP
ncbi:MAG: tryptophan 2,3-dioxygenase [Bradymonadia bacterium]|jgi:tryptophan 2,3-dioxygenase